MFQFSSNSDFMRIGSRNIEAVQAKLTELRIPVSAKDLGGNCGRTIEFDPQTSKLKIRTRSEEHTSELQSRFDLVCRLLHEKKRTTLEYMSYQTRDEVSEMV